MTQPKTRDELVLQTKWFDVVARHTDGSADPHYLINSSDFVVVTALNPQGELLLVRQIRPAINGPSVELPSGHVDPGENPEQAARRELLEETGHVAQDMELITKIAPAIGRYTNWMWCYFVREAVPVNDPAFKLEEGLELVPFSGNLRSLLELEGFCSSLSYGALLATILKGRLDIKG
jgi:ADP-ribose pyrophosphatase